MVPNSALMGSEKNFKGPLLGVPNNKLPDEIPKNKVSPWGSEMQLSSVQGPVQIHVQQRGNAWSAAVTKRWNHTLYSFSILNPM